MQEVLESPNTNEMIAELFPKNDDKEHQEISEDFKNSGRNQGNIEAHEMLMITDVEPCQTCYHYETPGHTLHVWRGKSRSMRRSQGKVVKNVMTCSEYFRRAYLF